MPVYNLKCATCGKNFIGQYYRRKYCDKCWLIAKKTASNKYQERKKYERKIKLRES